MFASNKIVEYQVRPVTRYIITRYHNETTPTGGASGGVETLGEFPNQVTAELIAQALAEKEQDAKFATKCSGPIPTEPSPS